MEGKRTKSSSSYMPNTGQPLNLEAFAKVVRSYRHARHAMRFIDDSQMARLFEISTDFLSEIADPSEREAEKADIKGSEKLLATVQRMIKEIESSIRKSRADSGPWTKKSRRILLAQVAQSADAVARKFAFEMHEMRARKSYLFVANRKAARQRFALALDQFLGRRLPATNRNRHINEIMAAILCALGEWRSSRVREADISRIRHLRSEAKAFKQIPASDWDEYHESLSKTAVRKRNRQERYDEQQKKKQTEGLKQPRNEKRREAEAGRLNKKNKAKLPSTKKQTNNGTTKPSSDKKPAPAAKLPNLAKNRAKKVYLKAPAKTK